MAYSQGGIVIAADPFDATADTTVSLRDVASGVRSALDRMLDERTTDQTRVERGDPAVAEVVAEFAADTDGILTHVGAFTVAVER